MANFIKLGEGLQVQGLPTANRPSTPLNGMIYYDTDLSQFQKYEAGAWSAFAAGSVNAGIAGRLAVYPASGSSVDDEYLQNANAINVAIVAQAGRTAPLTYNFPNPGNAVGSADLVLTEGAQTIAGNKTLSGTTNLSALTASKPLLLDASKNIVSTDVSLTSQVAGILPVANGGTNSGAALVNNRVIVSSGGAIVENAAITASRALASDVNGLPVASATTATELGYLSGVTSSVQTQIDSKVAKAGDAMTGDLTFATTKGIQSTAAASTLNIGTNGNSSTINLGTAGSTVNINGTLTYVNTTNTDISDKLVTLNKGGAAASASGTGLEFEENAVATGFIKTSADRSGIDVKAPATAGTAKLVPHANSHTYNFPDADGTLMTKVVQDTSPQLGGALDVNGQAIISATNGSISVAPHGTGRVRLSNAGTLTRYVDEAYFDSISLTASTTAVAASLTFDATAIKAQHVEYMVTEATTNKRKTGKLMVVCDGASGAAPTLVSIVDLGNETADVGVTWSAAVNLNNVELSYTTSANAKTMRAVVKRFLA